MRALVATAVGLSLAVAIAVAAYVATFGIVAAYFGGSSADSDADRLAGLAAFGYGMLLGTLAAIALGVPLGAFAIAMAWRYLARAEVGAVAAYLTVIASGITLVVTEVGHGDVWFLIVGTGLVVLGALCLRESARVRSPA